MKVPAAFRFFSFLFASFVFCISPGLAIASGPIVSDDFDNIDFTKWNVSSNLGGTVEPVNSNIKLSSTYGAFFPYVYLKNVQFPSNNFTVEFKFNFSGIFGYGNGLILSDTLLTNGTRADISPNDVMFQIWPYLDSIGVWTTLCSKSDPNCVMGSYTLIAKVPRNTWNSIKIVENSGSYIVTGGGYSFETRNSNRKISQFWLGNPQNTYTDVNWTSILMDYFRLYENAPINTRVPVVILPGFGASWNLPALLDEEIGGVWTIPSFVKNYDGIKLSLLNAGYVEGTDLFMFTYDWRKSLNNLAVDLDTFISDKGLSSKKINLIGHSMGGMVARAYGQKYGTTKIDKILTIGSPHLGAIDMYGLWEGAKIWDGVWWQNVLLETATEVNRHIGETKVAAIRRVSPSIIDLFPTFTFLNFSGAPKRVESMIEQNFNLQTLNTGYGSLEGKLVPFWSNDRDTTRNIINVTDRNAEDIAVDKWIDGSPVGTDPFGRTLGDGTVTKDSAIGPFSPGVQINGWHSDLLSNQENIRKIFSELGISPTLALPITETPDARTNSFVTILRSPGVLKVCNKTLTLCDEQLGGLYFSGQKLFVLPGYTSEDLVVSVTESGESGTYKLHIGNIDESPNWISFDGDLKTPGQRDVYEISSSEGNVSGYIDTQSPTITIVSPETKIYFSYDLPVLNYTVADDRDSNPVVEEAGWSIAAGPHTLTIKATDKSGNISIKSVSYEIVSDTTPPVVTISAPLATTYQIANIPDLSYTVTDDFDANPTIEVTGWTKTLGSHTVTVKATDKSGNIGSASVTFLVQGSPTSKEQCKKDLWKLFRFLGFKNQGACVDYVKRISEHKPEKKTEHKDERKEEKKEDRRFHFENIWFSKNIFHRD